MEKGGDDSSSSGFSVLDKKSSSNTDFVSSMKSHTTTEVFPSKIHHHHRQGSFNLGRPFDGDDDEDDDGGGGGRVGPTGGGNEVLGDIYRHDFSSSVAAGGIFANKTAPNFQSFNILPSSYSTIPYKSPGGGMGFPFTAAQWKELERQAMIYKCMISSVPVPPYLLLPLSTNFSATSADSSLSSLYSGRYSKNGDPEPGRCKRTDGKKWRCAKEVAPQQKYCERHLHRGRPRSRKPVEPKTSSEVHKKTRLQHTKPQPLLPPNHQPLLLLNAKTDLTISPPYYKPTTRDLGEAEMEQPPWENLMEPNMGLSNCYLPQDYMEPSLNVFSYPNFPTPEIDLPTRFIDAWSIDNLNTRNSIGNIKPSMSINEGDLSPSLNLSMAMAAGNVKDCDDDKSKDPTWLSPVSWEAFAGGGPLGEALQPGSMAVGGSNPTSPYNSMSTPATSPSGVLHWTLFSHSDSSVCNSPTLVAPPSEGSNQWQN